MKKTLIGLVVLALGLPMAAFALPPVSVDGCGYATALSGGLVSFMSIADDDEVVGGVTLVDFEASGMVGEDWVWAYDLPDTFQLALLGAAMCEVPELEMGFGANLMAFNSVFVGALEDLNTWATDASAIEGAANAVAAMFGTVGNIFGVPEFPGATDGATLTAFLNVALPGDDNLELRMTVLAMCTDVVGSVMLTEDFPAWIPALFTGLAEMIEDDVTAETAEYIGGMALGLDNVITGLMSLSTASYTQMCEYIEKDLLGSYLQYAAYFDQFSDVCGVLAAFANATPSCAAYVAPLSAAAGSFSAGAGYIEALADDPTPITILGAPTKAAEDEPFGNLGDYDGNGFNNVNTYNATIAHGGDVADFVEAASGVVTYNVPAAGLLGLAALVSAFAAGGAFVLRKK